MKLLLEEIFEKKSLDDSSRVVEKGIVSMTISVANIENETDNITDKSSQKVRMPRRSERIRKPPNRYEANIIVPDTNDEDPSTYKDAMIDTDKEKQHEAISQEMKSICFNLVWELVDLPKGFRPIGNKWIYKRRKEPDGYVKIYKARLVVKGYTQKE